jgi:hypothetical protein
LFTNIEYCWLLLITIIAQVSLVVSMSKVKPSGCTLRPSLQPLSCQWREGEVEEQDQAKTFLGNPLCRGVDELCTELLNACDGFVANLIENPERLGVVLSENLELRREEFGLKTENERPEKENNRQDMLLFYYTEGKMALMYLGEQHEAVLMHYNELQSRSAEAEAMAMNFEQRAAGAVAKKGWIKGQTGPEKRAGIKSTTGRGKANHSEWVSGEISVENPTSEMAPPRKLKKDEEDNFPTAMEL